MYDRLYALYVDGRLDDAGLNNAVSRGWITTDEAAQIRAAKSP